MTSKIWFTRVPVGCTALFGTTRYSVIKASAAERLGPGQDDYARTGYDFTRRVPICIQYVFEHRYYIFGGLNSGASGLTLMLIDSRRDSARVHKYIYFMVKHDTLLLNVHTHTRD